MSGSGSEGSLRKWIAEPIGVVFDAEHLRRVLVNLLDNARKFADWALTVDAQKIGLEVKEYAIPTNKSVPLPATVPNLTEYKVIGYDFAKYGSSETRKRLLERWEKEIGQATK